MKVTNSININHILKFVPRFTPDNTMVLTLKSEEKKTVETIPFTFSYLDGICIINFTKTFTNKTNFQIKITQGIEVIYRGKLFITN